MITSLGRLGEWLELVVVAIQDRLHRLAFVDDFSKGSIQCPINFRPPWHMGPWVGVAQGFLDGGEVGDLPGFEAAIGIAAERWPTER
jgi:hypothetical protein